MTPYFIRKRISKAIEVVIIIMCLFSLVYLSIYFMYHLYQWFFITVPITPGLTLGEEKSELLKLSKRTSPGHVLISSRSLVMGNGSLTKGRSKVHWSGIKSQDEILTQLSPSRRSVIIFVHGYNTTAEEAVTYGERLHSFLCEMDYQACSSIIMFSFLWRGDLGEANFRVAQEAAKISAHSFSAFVRQLSEQRPGIPILIFSHSLGAHVVLEGFEILRETEAKEWVRAAILIQPAVTVASVSKWMAPHWLLPFKRFRKEVKGHFWEALKSSHKVFATASNNDSILKGLFPHGNEMTNQPFPRALGIATDFHDEKSKIYVESYGKEGEVTVTYTDRESPVVIEPIPYLDHSAVFSTGERQNKILADLINIARKQLPPPFTHESNH